MAERTTTGAEKRKMPIKTKERPATEWLEICIEFSKLRGQGVSAREAVRVLGELRNPDGSLRYGKVPLRCLYRRYTPFARARMEEMKKQYTEHCVETMEGYDLVLRRAFAEKDHRLAKDTLRDKHETGKDMGIFPRGPPDRIEVSGPGFFEAVTFAIKNVKEQKTLEEEKDERKRGD